MRFLRNLLAMAIVGGAAYGYVQTKEGTDLSSWGRSWLGRVIPSTTSAQHVVTGPAVDHPAKLFRFDITPEWVMRHWSRVTTGLSDLRWTGYRVAVVTGTEPGDLAGALTYYFDDQGQVRRIAFVGITGDARYLTEWVARQFGYSYRQQRGDSVVYFPARSGQYRGSLEITSKASAPSGAPGAINAYDVQLVIER